jgi:hypothetical protein
MPLLLSSRVGIVLAVLVVTVSGAAGQPARRPVEIAVPVLPPRDVPPVSRSGTSALHGRVIDGASGAALARARVRLQGGGSQRSVLTDSGGNFAFTNVPSGSYMLVAEKSSYLPGQYPSNGRSLRSMGRPLVVRDGQVLQDVKIPLFRGGAITGRVVDAHGDPAEFTEVRVLQLVGGRTPAMRGSSQTNDLGEFRVGRLQPGSYVIQVNPRRGPEDVSADGSMFPQPLPTHYPNAATLEQAQPIVVQRGQTTTGIEVVLNEGLPTIVAGVVLNREGQAVPNGTVGARTFKDGQPDFGGGTPIRPDGTFRLQIPPGDYVFEARTMQPGIATGGRQSEQFGSVRLTVGPGLIDGVAITVGRGAVVSGRVIFEGATLPAVPMAPIHLPLVSPSGQCRSGQAQVAADWTFRVDGLAGICSPPSTTMFGRWTLKAVLYGNENLLDRAIIFEPDQHLRDIQVIFTDRRTEVTFSVTDERGQPTREYAAIIFPADKSLWTRTSPFIRTYVPAPIDLIDRRSLAASAPVAAVSGAQGSMRPDSVAGLRPGEYYAIALDDIEFEAARDPEVLERLLSHATRFAVSLDTNIEIPLQRIKLSDALPQR